MQTTASVHSYEGTFPQLLKMTVVIRVGGMYCIEVVIIHVGLVMHPAGNLACGIYYYKRF